MREIPLRVLVAKLILLALSASAVTSGAEPSPAMRSAIDDVDLDASVAIDRERVDPRDAAALLGRGLAEALGELRPLAATHLATTWALADDPLRRLAIATALARTFPLVGDAAVIDHLARDPDPDVRAAATRAAAVRSTRKMV